MQKVVNVINDNQEDLDNLNNLLKDGWIVISSCPVSEHVAGSTVSGNYGVYFVIEKKKID